MAVNHRLREIPMASSNTVFIANPDPSYGFNTTYEVGSIDYSSSTSTAIKLTVPFTVYTRGEILTTDLAKIFGTEKSDIKNIPVLEPVLPKKQNPQLELF